MPAREVNFTPHHQSRYVKFADTIEGGLTFTPCNQSEEVALPPRPVIESHLEGIGLHAAASELRNMWEPKNSELKDGYTSSAGIVFQSWLKDICVHLQDQRLVQWRGDMIGEGLHCQICPG